MVDFICDGLTRAVRIMNEIFLPTVGFEPGTFHLGSERTYRCATRADVYQVLQN